MPESYQRDNAALFSFLALVAVGVAAWVAASRLRSSLSMRSTDGRHRWSRAAALSAIVLALLAPLLLWAGADAMFALAYTDPSFDAWGLVLEVVPAALVSAAAVRCARTGLRDTHGQPHGRALALSATVLAYLVAALMTATALVACAAMLGQGG
ncbi:hypothetical protein ACFWUU_02440 [Kribbella sp. NPDC058693]|uniref:hypothetical protein n=1 Tax=Kribbella sp. NPDC058693 TaxID=3346602 RepID=UPI00365E217C